MLDKYAVQIICVGFYGLCYIVLLPFADGHYGYLFLSAFIIWVIGILPVTFVLATVVSLFIQLSDFVRQLIQPEH